MTETNCDEKFAAPSESPGLDSSLITEHVTATSQESGPTSQTGGLRNCLDLNNVPKPLAELHLREGIDDVPLDVSTRLTSSWTNVIAAGQIIGLHFEKQWHVGKIMSVDPESGMAGFNWAAHRSPSVRADDNDSDTENPAFEHLAMASAVAENEMQAKIAFFSPWGKSMWEGIPMSTREEFDHVMV
eukprot:jgi/Bigna1/81788/fgenesh1_pg.84_\